MTRRSAPPSVHLRALLIACLASLVVSLAGELTLRELAVHALDVPTSLGSIQMSTLAVSALIPVVGNGLGYFMVYRQPAAKALLLFMGPGVLLTAVGLSVSLVQLPPAPETAAVIVTVLIALITPVATVAILLTRKNLKRTTVPLAALVR